MNKVLKIILIVLLAVLLLAGGLFASLFGVGPVDALIRFRNSRMPGNAEQYGFEHIESMDDSPLAGKRVLVLGSSVAYGASSNEQAVGEYLSARMGCDLLKVTVSGTSLADITPWSYPRRLMQVDPGEHVDLLICQLSTNDASLGCELGEISADGAFDLGTTTGAIEHIITYARDTWGCPVVFFTGSHYDSDAYDAMVNRLFELQEKYEIGVIDLWTGEEFNAITDEQRALYMADDIHPTRAGYRDWWGPEMEAQLCEILKEEF